MVFPSTPAGPVVWALHDGKAGMASQVLGLAEATGFPFVEKRLAIRFPWSALPPPLWFLPFYAARENDARLMPPWPDLVIACGRNAAMPALAIKRASGGRTLAVQIQNPGVGRAEFDLFVVPAHDSFHSPRTIVTLGAVHRVTPARLAADRARFPKLAKMPRPVFSVLLGGTNKAYRMSRQGIGELAGSLAAILRAGGSALITPSRRTGEAGLALLRDRLAGLSAWIWDGSGENPYFAILALADAFLVTADSISMISEAAATGKPVHILGLDGGNAKFARFHAAMRAAGITRPFLGQIESWSYPIPDDTARAGSALRRLLLSRCEQHEDGREVRLFGARG
ncbi:MAG: mitochondrial fission ELM1 family protein [Alphaproteobacteria bacterium]|nr:mitochondrial fission ELM1 family protein [Alphaproteobacteria bacterium]